VVVQRLAERASQWEETNASMMELTSRLNSAESERSESEARLCQKEADLAAAMSAQQQAQSDRARIEDQLHQKEIELSQVGSTTTWSSTATENSVLAVCMEAGYFSKNRHTMFVTIRRHIFLILKTQSMCILTVHSHTHI